MRSTFTHPECPCTEYKFDDNIIECKSCGLPLKDLRTNDERRADSQHSAWDDWDTLDQEAES